MILTHRSPRMKITVIVTTVAILTCTVKMIGIMKRMFVTLACLMATTHPKREILPQSLLYLSGRYLCQCLSTTLSSRRLTVTTTVSTSPKTTMYLISTISSSRQRSSRFGTTSKDSIFCSGARHSSWEPSHCPAISRIRHHGGLKTLSPTSTSRSSSTRRTR